MKESEFVLVKIDTTITLTQLELTFRLIDSTDKIPQGWLLVGRNPREIDADYAYRLLNDLQKMLADYEHRFEPATATQATRVAIATGQYNQVPYYQYVYASMTDLRNDYADHTVGYAYTQEECRNLLIKAFRFMHNMNTLENFEDEDEYYAEQERLLAEQEREEEYQNIQHLIADANARSL